MSLKILIADDSMTAQNMGKKILADAGFDVVPVSNGAAAVKKIAETKPDIIILDIFMPGYTGLEVCDKVKSAPETANVPVLLTVGKLEPYRPEEGAKVRAEGVIIKPFEASDLLSAVAKIAEKYNLNVPQIDPVEVAPESAAPAETASVAAAAHVSQSVTGYAAAASIAAAEPEPYKPEVPSFIREATAAAAAPAPMFIIEETPEESSLPSFDLSDLSSMHEATASAVEKATPSVEEAPLAFSASSVPDPTASGRWNFGSSQPSPSVDPMLDMVAKSEAATATDPELETTAAAKVEGDVESLVELETSSEAPVQVETVADPSLVTDPDELMQFTIKVGTDKEEIPGEHDPLSKGEVPVSQTSEEVEAPVEQAAGDETTEFAAAPPAAHSYEDDPLVQMGAITVEPEPEAEVAVQPVAHVTDVGDDTMRLSLAQSSGLEGALHEFEATEEVEEDTIVLPEVQEVPAPEHHEAIAAAAAESHVEPEVVEPVADAMPEFHEPYAEPATHEVEATIAAAVDTVAAEHQQESKTMAAAAGLDASQVARAVQKVFERYREQMVADITDELSKGE